MLFLPDDGHASVRRVNQSPIDKSYPAMSTKSTCTISSLETFLTLVTEVAFRTFFRTHPLQVAASLPSEKRELAERSGDVAPTRLSGILIFVHAGSNTGDVCEDIVDDCGYLMNGRVGLADADQFVMDQMASGIEG